MEKVNSEGRDGMFDVLKGFAIYLVVLGHVLLYQWHGYQDGVLTKFIVNFHMPLFFFISGWFSWKLTAEGELRYPDLWRRFRQLMVPMAVVSTLMIFYYSHWSVNPGETPSFRWLWTMRSKAGYWFPLSLFEIFMIFVPFVWLFRRMRGFVARGIWTLAVWGTLFGIATLLIHAGERPDAGESVRMANMWLNDCLQLRDTMLYLLPFMCGALMASRKDDFYRLTEDSRFMTVVILLLMTGFMLVANADTLDGGWAGLMVKVMKPLVHVLFAVLAVAVARPWCRRVFSPERKTPHRLATMWAYMGRNSLGIYLLHYFFLYPMGPLTGVIDGMGRDVVPQLVIGSAVAFTVIGAALALIRVLSPSEPLSRLFTGTWQR